MAKQYPEIVKQEEAHFKDARTETDHFPYGGVMQKEDAQNEYTGWIRPKPGQ